MKPSLLNELARLGRIDGRVLELLLHAGDDRRLRALWVTRRSIREISKVGN